VRPERQGRVRAGIAGWIERPARRDVLALGVVGSQSTEAVPAFISNLVVLHEMGARMGTMPGVNGDLIWFATRAPSFGLMRHPVGCAVHGAACIGRVIPDCRRGAGRVALARRCRAFAGRNEDAAEDRSDGNDGMGT
jgi:hypothetical protein